MITNCTSIPLAMKRGHACRNNKLKKIKKNKKGKAPELLQGEHKPTIPTSPPSACQNQDRLPLLLSPLPSTLKMKQMKQPSSPPPPLSQSKKKKIPPKKPFFPPFCSLSKPTPPLVFILAFYNQGKRSSQQLPTGGQINHWSFKPFISGAKPCSFVLFSVPRGREVTSWKL